ncbi:MAG: DUF5640 domain-containing protein [Lachnospiraceae bacterium]|jgi:hypothetical protein|nr:DUF5640 domain-containing protein [Lachnospiraceae bacterium]MCH4070926.1 DUF5640 domain-containing protein [Lachnospiraceae bacterium]MCH4107916.1 DUF5640 domain-containing protein [Lachnospiraceae bacterium]MCI1332261.1 DUF5640 domain-containing protein [Lachnospiraceae bacterium]MCI1361622.1 DUF5640 domain-containing protein [Lachnospiraceae bacterium]
MNRINGILKKSTVCAAALAASCVLLTGCCDAPSITGTWNGTDTDGTAISYTFNEDGTGSCTDGDDTVSLQYKNDTDNQVIWIKAAVTGQNTEIKLVYEVKNGKLILTGEGASTTFEKASAS